MASATAAAARATTGGALEERCRELFAAERLPGLAVAVVRRESEPQTAFLGYADVERGWPPDSRTVYRIGSVSKTMTAIAVMQLVEAGRVDLDDPVNRHLRDFAITPPDGTRDVTIRDLLTHTSGLGMVRRPSDLLKPLGGLASPVGAMPEIREYYRGGLTAHTAPGTRWSYANHGFTVLGQVISDVSGVPYPEYMERHLFAPLGMRSTAVRLDRDLLGRLAVGYAARKRNRRRVKFRDIIVEAAGSIFSDTDDMILYAQAMLGAGANANGRVIGAESLELMTRIHFSCDSRLPVGFGLGFLVEQVAGHRTFWHSGGWPGFGTMFSVFPDDGVAVIIFANALSAGLTTIAEEIARHALGEPPAAKRTALTAVAAPVADAITGTYAPHDRLVDSPLRWTTMGLGGGLKVSRSGDGLEVRGRIPVGPGRTASALQRTGDDPYVFEAVVGGRRQPLAFQTGPEGAVTGVCVGGLFSLRKL